MSTTHVRTVRCPVCGGQARVTVDGADDAARSHAHVRDYDCPNGCRVDDETVRQLIGAQ